ncbi:MAG: M24 family metallopeptidase [Planctomycetes bacterium]|nr:M24 family metallopeptidase [Planctomycetota bacterium]
MFALSAVQAALREFGMDAWLLYDFRSTNLLARRVLDVPAAAVTTRRFFYLVPAQGEPHKLVHRIEAGVLDHLPGEKTVYLKWQELEAGIEALIAARTKVAMEYAPRNSNPYVSRVDAGTVELVRSFGAEVVSSGDLVQLFEATLDSEQQNLHREAAIHTDSAFARVWKFIAEGVASNGAVEETDVQNLILEHFAENELVTDHPPIVAVGPNSGDPHYETGTGADTAIRAGSLVLIDLWGKLDRPRAIYSDLTRVGYVGESVPDRYEEIFRIVASARDAGLAFLRKAFSEGRRVAGWEVDRACRRVIEKAGYGDAFVHRTGHSIGQETHGNGANIDDLETHEERRILARTCFSIEPGIYLPEFGIRSELNVLIDAHSMVHVTGGDPQQAVQAIV